MVKENVKRPFLTHGVKGWGPGSIKTAFTRCQHEKIAGFSCVHTKPLKLVDSVTMSGYRVVFFLFSIKVNEEYRYMVAAVGNQTHSGETFIRFLE